MRIGDMYPSKYLNYRQFAAGELVVVTIKSIVPEQIRIPGGFNRQGQPGAAQGAGEASWLMYLEEFALPFKLRPGRLNMITAVVGLTKDDEPAKLVGRKFGIIRGFTSIGTEVVEGLKVYEQPIPPSHQIAARPADPLFNRDRVDTVISTKSIEQFKTALMPKGKRWDDFMAWAKGKSAELHGALLGRALDEIPAGAAPGMRAYLDELSGGAKPAAAAGTTHKDGPFAAPQEEDIPF